MPSTPDMPTTPHLSRLQLSLRDLLARHRSAALATQPADSPAPGAGDALPAPRLSMVPWAWNAQFGCFVLHVSALAAHTRAMELHPAVSLLVCAAEVDGLSPQAPGTNPSPARCGGLGRRIRLRCARHRSQR